MSKEFTYIDDEHLKSYLAHIGEGYPVSWTNVQTLVRDLMLTLEEDRKSALVNSNAATNHIEELIVAGRIKAQKIERLESALAAACNNP